MKPVVTVNALGLVVGTTWWRGIELMITVGRYQSGDIAVTLVTSGSGAVEPVYAKVSENRVAGLPFGEFVVVPDAWFGEISGLMGLFLPIEGAGSSCEVDPFEASDDQWRVESSDLKTGPPVSGIFEFVRCERGVWVYRLVPEVLREFKAIVRHSACGDLFLPVDPSWEGVPVNTAEPVGGDL